MGSILMGISTALAQTPEVGREAAARYFGAPVSAQSVGPGNHYLALHAGSFMDSSAWEWKGNGRRNKVGSNTFGVTYRLDEWNQSMDWNLRVDFSEYKLDDEKPLKMSLLPLLTFPNANARFPLYFGGGLGLGVFFQQIENESPLSLDYQLVLGARFFDVFGNAGFFIETGLKNHLLLTSSGQYNGVFLAGGALFTF